MAKKFLILSGICFVLIFTGDAMAVSRNQAEEYLSEFASQTILKSCPHIYRATVHVLENIPQEVFDKVTSRDYPALFTEYYPRGQARLANSSSVLLEEGDPPTFGKGLWIIKLNTELEDSKNELAIQGVVAHELAHQYLGHSGAHAGMEDEKAANRLIQKWGFEIAYKKAKKLWGKS